MNPLPIYKSQIRRFISESNRIEGILREPSSQEILETETFLRLPVVTVESLKALVGVYQPDAVIRDHPDLNVRVGNHFPPHGGPHVVFALEQILASLSSTHPWKVHLAYETLHPFTDGNGRSGRALWAWQMLRKSPAGLPLGFLHEFYYQTLQHSGDRT